MKLKAGNSSFWLDNWTSLGALYFIEREKADDEEFEDRNLINGNEWQIPVTNNLMLEKITSYIIRDIKSITNNTNDKPWWTVSSTGLFSIKSAYQILRKKKHKVDYYVTLWRIKFPHKVNFYLWRVIHRRISTNDVLKGMDIPIASRCWYCEDGRVETLNHIFLTSLLAQKLWGAFILCVGFNQWGDLSLKQNPGMVEIYTKLERQEDTKFNSNNIDLGIMEVQELQETWKANLFLLDTKE